MLDWVPYLDIAIFLTTLDALNVVILPPFVQSSSRFFVLSWALSQRHLSLHCILHGSQLIYIASRLCIATCLSQKALYALLLIYAIAEPLWFLIEGTELSLVTAYIWQLSPYPGSCCLMLALLLIWMLLPHIIWLLPYPSYYYLLPLSCVPPWQISRLQRLYFIMKIRFSKTNLHKWISHFDCCPLSWSMVFITSLYVETWWSSYLLT